MNNEYDIFSDVVGLDSWLRRGGAELSVVDFSNEVSDFTGSSSLIPNEITDVVEPSSIVAGELGALIGHGKKTFADTTAGFLMGLDTDGVYKWVIGNSSNYIDWSVTTVNVLTLAGSGLALTSGSIAGMTITSTALTATAGGNSTIVSSGSTAFTAGPTGSPAFTVTQAGAVTASNMTITGGSISGTTTVGIGNVNIAARGWTQTSVFSITDADTVAWASGTFTSADGTAYSIGGGNTGNMAAATYIYLDTAVSTTAYQITTTAATAVGAGKVLIAKAQNGTGEATFQVFGGIGGTNIDAASIVANSITANELSTSITYAGTLIIASSGHVRSGQTAYNTGTGWFIGNDSSTPKLSIGDTTTANSLTWDGSTLLMNGSTLANQDIFGNGADGAATISSNTTLTSDKYYTTLTIDNGFTLNTGGYRIFCKTSFTNNGTVAGNGNDGAAGAAGSGANGGAGGTAGAQTSGFVANTAGKTGGNGGNSSTNGAAGVAGTNNTDCINGAGAAGGAGGQGVDGATYTGGAAGSAGTAATITVPRNAIEIILFRNFTPTTSAQMTSGGGSGSGGGGGNSGGGGGASGATGVPVIICAKTYTNNGTITSLGGAGGAGGNGAGGGPTAGGGGGGGGARAGAIFLIYGNKTASGTLTVTGGAAGAGGIKSNGAGGSTDGAAGTAGGSGTTYEIVI